LISFRFHIVSIVAVFLALAIGIVVGSTLIDRAIVDGLENRVDEVSNNLDERQAENDRLDRALDQLEGWATEAGPAIVEGRLEDTATVVVVDRGVDREQVDRTIELLTESGSTIRGVLTVDDAWSLDDPETQAAVAEIVGVDVEEPVRVLQERAAAVLVADLSSPTEVVNDGTGALDTLTDLGLVEYEPVTDVVIDRPRLAQFVLITGTQSEVEPADHIADFASAALGVSGAVLGGEVFVEEDAAGAERGDTLAPILNDAALAPLVASVDHLDTVPGPVTAVLALVAAREGTVGHYGVGGDADALAPAPSET
jgi:Copper transport outer membrane protein, MctB